MAEISKQAGKVEAGPDPDPDCPRCNYFARRQAVLDDRLTLDPYPPLDQHKVSEILRIAFPPSKR